MGKQKSRSSRVSNGGRQKSNVAHEAKRQEKFKAKREAGNAYQYRPNPYDKKNEYEKWHDEDITRREKNKSSKLPLARLTSIFAKLDNQLAREILLAKDKEQKRKVKG